MKRNIVEGIKSIHSEARIENSSKKKKSAALDE
jgi:hypothetical protein